LDLTHEKLYGALKRTLHLKTRDIKENDEILFQVMEKFTGKIAKAFKWICCITVRTKQVFFWPYVLGGKSFLTRISSAVLCETSASFAVSFIF